MRGSRAKEIRKIARAATSDTKAPWVDYSEQLPIMAVTRNDAGGIGSQTPTGKFEPRHLKEGTGRFLYQQIKAQYKAHMAA